MEYKINSITPKLKLGSENKLNHEIHAKIKTEEIQTYFLIQSPEPELLQNWLSPEILYF